MNFKKKVFFIFIHCLNLNIKTVFKEQSKQLEVTNKKQHSAAPTVNVYHV